MAPGSTDYKSGCGSRAIVLAVSLAMLIFAAVRSLS